MYIYIYIYIYVYYIYIEIRKKTVGNKKWGANFLETQASWNRFDKCSDPIVVTHPAGFRLRVMAGPASIQSSSLNVYIVLHNTDVYTKR